MKRTKKVLILLVAVLALAGCEVDYADDPGDGGWNDGSGGTNNNNNCPSYDETDIRGVENDQWIRLVSDGDVAPVYLQTVRNSSHFASVQWNVGSDRQTCAVGPVTSSHGSSALLVGIGDSGSASMQVAAGLNYIDYQAYGCTPFDCDTLIESGTIVLDVDTQ
jgi:hypothetical protein